MLLHCLSPVCCPVTDPTRLTPEQEAQLTSLFVGPTVGEMLHLRAVANHVWQSLPPRQRNYGTVWFQLMHMLLPAPQLGPLNDALAAGMNMLEAVTAHPQLVTQLLFAMPACLPLWHAPPHPARDADLLLRCVAQNVCGLRAHAQSTFTLISTLQPALFFASELKQTPTRHPPRWVRDVFPNMHLQLSCHPCPPPARPRAGVLTAVAAALPARGVDVSSLPCPPALHGYLSHTRLHALGAPAARHCISVYLPIDERRTAVVDAVAAYIQATMQSSPADMFLVGGDLNGVQQAADRSAGSLTPADTQLLATMEACGLVSVFSQCLGPRPHTFHSTAASARLDDFLCKADDPLIAHLAASPQPQIVASLAACHSDHRPVSFAAPASVLLGTMLPPAQPAQPAPQPAPAAADARPVFARPFPPDKLLAFQHQAGAECGARALEAATAIHAALAADAVPRAAADALLLEGWACLQQACEVAYQVLPTKQQQLPAQRPPAGQQRFYSRARARQHTAHLKHVTACRKMARLLHKLAQGRTTWRAILDSPCSATITADADLAAVIAPPSEEQAAAPGVLLEYGVAVHASRMHHKAALRTLRRGHATDCAHKERKLFAQRYHACPNRVAKELFGTDNNTGDIQHTMPVVQHPTQGLVTEPAAIREAIHFHHLSSASPKVPAHLADKLPWEQEGAPDRHATDRRGLPNSSLFSALTMHAFRACLSGLSNGTATGTDGLPNEVLKHMPPQLVQLMLELMRLCWRTGRMPPSCLHSTTLLFLKRQPASCPANYRPIALHTTFLKLYTRLIAQVLSSYAERHSIFSHMQEGFRPNRGTRDLLQYLTMVLEDAKHSRSNLFMAKLDWANAFGSLEHSRLYVIMRKLGFPADAVAAVKSVYDGAHTSIATPHGPTKAINIRRGVIQGDTLSPLLFIIALEPLLRWLDAGDRGYALNCVRQHAGRGQVPPHHIRAPGGGYADDVLLLTGDAESMAVQLDKVSRYSEWSGMRLNAEKCETSAVLHATHSPTHAGRIRSALRNLHICGEPLTNVVLPTKAAGLQISGGLLHSHPGLEPPAQPRQGPATDHGRAAWGGPCICNDCPAH